MNSRQEQPHDDQQPGHATDRALRLFIIVTLVTAALILVAGAIWFWTAPRAPAAAHAALTEFQEDRPAAHSALDRWGQA